MCSGDLSVTEAAAVISMAPEICTDRSRSGVDDDRTAPAMKAAPAPTPSGTTAGTDQSGPNSGRPSTSARCRHAASALASTTAPARARSSAAAGEVPVCEKGEGLEFDELLAARVLAEPEVLIKITLHAGEAEAVCWGCDLTYDYVRINGDYRT